MKYNIMLPEVYVEENTVEDEKNNINFNNNQYFIICCLGVIFTFILENGCSSQ